MTGHTYNLINNNLNTKQFILECSRAFCYQCRDSDNLPQKETVSDYHLKELNKAHTSYEDLKIHTKPQKIEHVQNFISANNKSRQESVEKLEIENSKLQEIINNIQKWKPRGKIKKVKQFALEQLAISLNNLDYYKQPEIEFNSEKDYIYYFNQNILLPAKENIKYHKKQYQNEVKKVTANNKWINELYRNVEKI